MSGDSNMTSLDQIARALLPSELVSAIDETPGLIVPVLGTFAIFEVMDFRSLIQGSALGAYTVEALLAALVGLIIYCGGNFWDSYTFGPRYGINGTYLSRKTRPFGIFPAGDDLSIARTEAAKALGLPESGEGAYSKSENLLRRIGRWQEVLPPIVLSKMARSFIWPALLAAIVTLIKAITGFAASEPASAIWSNVLFALVSSIIAFLAFIPYFELRVKHMIRLYNLVVSSVPSQKTPDTAAASGGAVATAVVR